MRYLRAALARLAGVFTKHRADAELREELQSVLEDWCPPFPGFFLYYPSQRQLPAALSALVDTLRLRQRKPTTP
jgi:DNA-binding transcriptional LysR family regulator